MEKFNVVVSKDGVAVAVSRSPLLNGTQIGSRAYQVEARNREEAKLKAKDRMKRHERSDSACWGH